MSEAERVALETEARIAAWLRDRAWEAKSPATEWPLWLGFLWVLFHPIKFAAERARFYALVEAEIAIEAGAYREGEG